MYMPPDWDPAQLTFQISPDNGVTWFNLLSQSNSDFMLNVMPGAAVNLPGGTPLDNKTWVKFRSGSAQYPAVQSEDRVFSVYTV
jgi:hypothetical protein